MVSTVKIHRNHRKDGDSQSVIHISHSRPLKDYFRFGFFIILVIAKLHTDAHINLEMPYLLS